MNEFHHTAVVRSITDYHFVCSFVPVIACLCTVHFDYLPVVWPDPTTNPSWHTRMSCDAASNYLYCRNCLLVSYGYFSLFVFCVFFNILRFGFRVTVSALWALLVLYTFVISLAFTNSWSIVIVCRVQWLWADQSCGLTPDPSTDHYCAWGQASEVLWQQHRYVASAVCLSVCHKSVMWSHTPPFHRSASLQKNSSNRRCGASKIRHFLNAAKFHNISRFSMFSRQMAMQ